MMKRFLLLSILGTCIVSVPAFSMEEEDPSKTWKKFEPSLYHDYDQEFILEATQTPLSSVPVPSEVAAATDPVTRAALLAKYARREVDLISPELQEAVKRDRLSHFDFGQTCFLPGSIVLALLEQSEEQKKQDPQKPFVFPDSSRQLTLTYAANLTAFDLNQYYAFQHSYHASQRSIEHFWDLNLPGKNVHFEYTMFR